MESDPHKVEVVDDPEGRDNTIGVERQGKLSFNIPSSHDHTKTAHSDLGFCCVVVFQESSMCAH